MLFPDRGCFVLVLEHLEGGSLSDMLAERGGKLEQREVASITFDMLQAMQHVHSKGIVHRDIKPDNILRKVSADGTVVYKLCDFVSVSHTLCAFSGPDSIIT